MLTLNSTNYISYKRISFLLKMDALKNLYEQNSQRQRTLDLLFNRQRERTLALLFDQASIEIATTPYLYRGQMPQHSLGQWYWDTMFMVQDYDYYFNQQEWPYIIPQCENPTDPAFGYYTVARRDGNPIRYITEPDHTDDDDVYSFFDQRMVDKMAYDDSMMDGSSYMYQRDVDGFVPAHLEGIYIFQPEYLYTVSSIVLTGEQLLERSGIDSIAEFREFKSDEIPQWIKDRLNGSR